MGKYITDKRYMLFLVLIMFIVAICFIGIILWPTLSEQGVFASHRTPEFTPTITPTPTALPTNFPNVIRDYFENQNGTNGVLAGSVVLVFVILFGVLISIRNNEK